MITQSYDRFFRTGDTEHLDDGDFQRFVESQGYDDKDILKSVQKMEKALTAQSGSGK